MKVKFLYFGMVRERLGRSESVLEIPVPDSVGSLFSGQCGSVAGSWARFVRFAVNGEYVTPDTVVNDGDEVAFIPPVSGG